MLSGHIHTLGTLLNLGKISTYFLHIAEHSKRYKTFASLELNTPFQRIFCRKLHTKYEAFYDFRRRFSDF